MRSYLYKSLSCFLLLYFFISCNHESQFRNDEGMAWNTLYHITYQSPDNLSDSIIRIFNEIDLSLSSFNQNSIVSHINVGSSDSVDSHFVKVYHKSREINDASGGIFDPTLAPLIRAWGFGQGHSVSADTLRLDSLMELVGIKQTTLEGKRLIKDNPSIEFNFSALAKGYGVDCIADMMVRNGVTNYLVEVGGEIRTAGHNPQGNKWCIGIDRPQPDNPLGDSILNLYIVDGAVATSGNYRNYHESEGGSFGHIISPLSGRPVKTEVISATVVATSCMEADALATCCMALSKDEALNLCTRMRAGVLLILQDLSIVTNPAFNSFLAE